MKTFFQGAPGSRGFISLPCLVLGTHLPGKQGITQGCRSLSIGAIVVKCILIEGLHGNHRGTLPPWISPSISRCGLPALSAISTRGLHRIDPRVKARFILSEMAGYERKCFSAAPDEVLCRRRLRPRVVQARHGLISKECILTRM